MAENAFVQVGWLRGDGSFHSLERNPNPVFRCEPVYARLAEDLLREEAEIGDAEPMDTTADAPWTLLPSRDGPRWSPMPVRWYAVVNDLVGGWAVSHINKPLSEQDYRVGEGEIADCATEEIARHIADLHNAWMIDREI